MKRIINFIAVLLILAACKHEILEPPASNCIPLPEGPSIGWNFIFPDTGYSAPCFNPENPDEIIYREHHFNTGEFWLCKLNLVTKEKEYIFQGNFWSYPKWGKNDWIVFTLSDANVYKIRPDGNQLTQLTNNRRSFTPGWSHDYNKIYYDSYIMLPPQQQKGIGISIDIEGSLIDTLWGGWGNHSEPLNDSLAAYISHHGLSIYNFKSGEHQYIFTNDPMEARGGTGIFKQDINTLVWSRMEGLYITDLNTQKTTEIAPTCNSDYYANPTYAPQTNKVIWEHIVKIPKGGYMDGKSEFVIMNPNGTSAEIINIP